MVGKQSEFVERIWSTPNRTARVAIVVAACALLLPSAAGAAPKAKAQSSGTGAAVGVAFGVGAVGLVVAGVSAGLMLNSRDELDEACGGTRNCPESSEDELQAYHTYGTISAVALGVGVAGALTGVSILLLADDDEESDPKLSAVVGPRFAGVKGAF